MPFSAPFAKATPGDFVYGLYDGNATITWLEKIGCVRVMSEALAVNAAFDMNDKYKTNPGGNHVIKRSSKMGLNLFVLKGRTVHFVLDNITMDQVPTKSNSRDVGENRSITGAELRWIYRHRDNDVIRENIQFWFKKAPTTPPWQSDSANYSKQWETYKRDSQPLLDVSSVNLAGPALVAAAPKKGLFSCLFCCWA